MTHRKISTVGHANALTQFDYRRNNPQGKSVCSKILGWNKILIP